MPTDMTSLTFQGLWRTLPPEDMTLAEPPAFGLRLSQFLCGLRRDGHQMILKTEGRRMYLVCRDCLRETPGWSTGKAGS